MSDQADRYSRLTYLAFGELPDEQRTVVGEQCAQFHAALQADRSAEQAAAVFPPNTREAAERAAWAVRAFEGAIGEKTGAPPTWVSRLGKRGTSFAIGLPRHFTGSRAAQDAAVGAAAALAELLTALGATEVDSAWMD